MHDAQQELDDEILSACHDGELPPTDAEAVRRRLAREPELAHRLRAMQYVDTAAAGAFRAHDRQALPERILKLLETAEHEHRERSGDVVLLQESSAHRRRPWSAAVSTSIASAIRRIRARVPGKRWLQR